VRPEKEPLHNILISSPAADTATLAALHSACFPDAWDAKAIAELLATPGAFSFHNQDGFVLARVAGGEAEILTLAVAPHARGRGLGRALLGKAIAQAEAQGALRGIGVCQGGDAQGLLWRRGCAGAQASAAQQIRLT
jgi:ribosomal-protein-alanine N-acetyltransferase